MSHPTLAPASLFVSLGLLASVLVGCSSGVVSHATDSDAEAPASTPGTSTPSDAGTKDDASGNTSGDEIPASCVLQKDSLSWTYCEGDAHERLFVCPSETPPKPCKSAAVANGYCCQSKVTSTKTQFFGCDHDGQGAYAHGAFVELTTFDGYEGIQGAYVGEIVSGAKAFTKAGVVGQALTSTSHVGNAKDYDYWLTFKDVTSFFGSEVSSGASYDLRKKKGSVCGEIGGHECVVTDLAEGEAIPSFDSNAAGRCNLQMAFPF